MGAFEWATRHVEEHDRLLLRPRRTRFLQRAPPASPAVTWPRRDARDGGRTLRPCLTRLAPVLLARASRSTSSDPTRLGTRLAERTRLPKSTARTTGARPDRSERLAVVGHGICSGVPRMTCHAHHILFSLVVAASAAGCADAAYGVPPGCTPMGRGASVAAPGAPPPAGEDAAPDLVLVPPNRVTLNFPTVRRLDAPESELSDRPFMNSPPGPYGGPAEPGAMRCIVPPRQTLAARP
jgi:hypothetical protein